MNKFAAWIIALSIGTIAHAEMEDAAAKASPHNANMSLSWNRGGFAFGAGYEYMHDTSTGFGGNFRMFQRDSSRSADGLFIVSGTLGHHFFKRAWDLSFTPGISIINIDSANARQDDTTVVGPSLGMGILWQMADKFAIGFDYTNYWAWFDSDHSGHIISDLAVKGKFNF